MSVEKYSIYHKIEDVLHEKGIYAGLTCGTSMYPMLRHQKDTIVIEPVRGRLKKYDVPLYKSHGKYILHRIVKVCEASYVLCGDNCHVKEYGITDDQIVGVLTAFYRDGQEVDIRGWRYRLYVYIRCHTFWLRRARVGISAWKNSICKAK